MNSLKDVLKKLLDNPMLKFSLIFGIAIIVLVIAFGYSIGVDITDNIKNEEIVNSEEKSEINVFYSEGDEDAAYNYIKNPGVLRNADMPYIGAVKLNDRIDYYLREKGYISESLKILNAKENGTIIYFDIYIESTEDIFSAEYDIRYDELNIKQ